MSEYIRRFAAPLALTLSIAVGACTTDRDDDLSLSQDSALGRDLELANQDTSALPSLTDVPAGTAQPAPGPVASNPAARPRPTPPRTTRPPASDPAPAPTTTKSGNTVARGEGSERGVGTIAAGSSIALASNERVCTNTHQVGDTFTATVSESVTGSNGAVIPAGATVVLTATELKRSENANDNISMRFSVSSVRIDGRNYPVNASVSDAQVARVRSSTRNDDVKKVVGGAIIGAIAGQVIGKDTKGTVIGAATGAAAGTAAAAATGNYEGCVENGGRIVVTLDAPATIQS